MAPPADPPLPAAKAVSGTLVHTPSLGSVQVLADHLLIVGSNGRIAFVGEAGTPEANAALAQHSVSEGDVLRLSETQLLLPGFVDGHFHAPQYEFAGTGTDLPLFDWLHTRTFPCEAAFADEAHARHVYARLVRRLLSLGTTTANYFTTLHTGATKALADAVAAAGQRAVIGRVCMDQHSPDNYSDADAQASLAGAAEVVAYIQSKGCSRILPSVIPRFIPTCSTELLQGLGALAAEHDLHVHSHISESREQVDFSKQLHPDAPHDAAVYDGAGLLRRRAVFAHGTQLTGDALALLAARGAGIVHCPLSNCFFGDGLLCVAQALAAGVHVALGTDIAGGYSPSMVVAQRMAVINSHALKAAALMAQQLGGRQAEDGCQPASSSQQEAGDAAAAAYGQQLALPGCGPAHGQAVGLAGARIAAAISGSSDVAAAALRHLLSWQDALYLATAGGAAALGLQDDIGQFKVGLAFDALLVDAGRGALDVFEGQKEPLALLEMFLNNGDDRNIVKVWVDGAVVVG